MRQSIRASLFVCDICKRQTILGWQNAWQCPTPDGWKSVITKGPWWQLFWIDSIEYCPECCAKLDKQ